MDWTSEHQRQWDALSLGEKERILREAKAAAARRSSSVRRHVQSPVYAGAPVRPASVVRSYPLDEPPVSWTAKHQKLWDRLEYVDPISPDGQRAYDERQQDLARAEVARQEREDRYEARNVRARLAGAVSARRSRVTPDPHGLGRGWGALAREDDRGDRFARGAANDYWGG